jgi:hypothetical protein
MPIACCGGSETVDAHRGISQTHLVAKHLFIVSRQQPDLFSYLFREFSAESEVTVIIDRRQGQRRANGERAASEERAADAERAVNEERAANEERALAQANRRQSDRRRKAELVSQLSSLGYAFVRLA